MSHTMNIATEVKDFDILKNVCQKLGVQFFGQGAFKLYDQEVKGLGIKFHNWQLPVIFDQEGKASFDNYRGSWGNEQDLYGLIARYGCEKAKYEAPRNNIYSWNEVETEETITLTLNLD
jgi:hypothetical protein